jgi:hypothetical protein
MTRKKKQSSTAGLYAMCITAGLMVGIGLAPVFGNFLILVILGGTAGIAAAYVINKNSPKPKRKHHP